MEKRVVLAELEYILNMVRGSFDVRALAKYLTARSIWTEHVKSQAKMLCDVNLSLKGEDDIDKMVDSAMPISIGEREREILAEDTKIRLFLPLKESQTSVFEAFNKDTEKKEKGGEKVKNREGAFMSFLKKRIPMEMGKEKRDTSKEMPKVEEDLDEKAIKLKMKEEADKTYKLVKHKDEEYKKKDEKKREEDKEKLEKKKEDIKQRKEKRDDPEEDKKKRERYEPHMDVRQSPGTQLEEVADPRQTNPEEDYAYEELKADVVKYVDKNAGGLAVRLLKNRLEDESLTLEKLGDKVNKSKGEVSKSLKNLRSVIREYAEQAKNTELHDRIMAYADRCKDNPTVDKSMTIEKSKKKRYDQRKKEIPVNKEIRKLKKELEKEDNDSKDKIRIKKLIEEQERKLEKIRTVSSSFESIASFVDDIEKMFMPKNNNAKIANITQYIDVLCEKIS